MPRWDPNARERLESAALDLFVEQGYEDTTVAQIADRAGLTRSTFFRHFADKREVVFGPQGLLGDLLAGAVRDEPDGRSVSEYLLAAFARADQHAFTPERHRLAIQRTAVIDANEGLRERELLKRAGMVDALVGAFVGHGFETLDARVAAELGVLALTTAFSRWAAPGAVVPFGEVAGAVVPDLLERAAAVAGQGADAGPAVTPT